MYPSRRPETGLEPLGARGVATVEDPACGLRRTLINQTEIAWDECDTT